MRVGQPRWPEPSLFIQILLGGSLAQVAQSGVTLVFFRFMASLQYELVQTVIQWIIALAPFVGGEMIFRKRIARGKTLLQKGFPPGPPFRKLLNDCGEALSQRQVRLPAHELRSIFRSSLRGDRGAAFLQERAPRTPCGAKETIHNPIIIYRIP